MIFFGSASCENRMEISWRYSKVVVAVSQGSDFSASLAAVDTMFSLRAFILFAMDAAG